MRDLLDLAATLDAYLAPESIASAIRQAHERIGELERLGNEAVEIGLDRSHPGNADYKRLAAIRVAIGGGK